MIYNDETDGALNVLFGHGSVLVSKARLESEAEERVIVLRAVEPPREVGVVWHDDPEIGKSTAEVPGQKIKLIFDNVAGIDSLVTELNLLRDGMPQRLTDE